jgi:acylphosphatase
MGVQRALRAHLVICGRVQGVGFRASAEDEAVRLGLTGYVKNLWSGEVEAVVEGEAASVEAFIDWCRLGPPLARVDRVVASRKPYEGEFEGFSTTAD